MVRLMRLGLAVCVLVPWLGASAANPPLQTVVVTQNQSVASGSALFMAVDREELNSLTTTGAVRMYNAGGEHVGWAHCGAALDDEDQCSVQVSDADHEQRLVLQYGERFADWRVAVGLFGAVESGVFGQDGVLSLGADECDDFLSEERRVVGAFSGDDAVGGGAEWE